MACFLSAFVLLENSETLKTPFKNFRTILKPKKMKSSNNLIDEDMGHTSAGAWQPAPSSTPALPPGTRTPEAPDPPSSARPRWRADSPVTPPEVCRSVKTSHGGSPINKSEHGRIYVRFLKISE